MPPGVVAPLRYVARVSPATTPLFPGIKRLLEGTADYGWAQGVLSNACGAYVSAVVEAHRRPQRWMLFLCVVV